MTFFTRSLEILRFSPLFLTLSHLQVTTTTAQFTFYNCKSHFTTAEIVKNLHDKICPDTYSGRGQIGSVWSIGGCLVFEWWRSVVRCAEHWRHLEAQRLSRTHDRLSNERKKEPRELVCRSKHTDREIQRQKYIGIETERPLHGLSWCNAYFIYNCIYIIYHIVCPKQRTA